MKMAADGNNFQVSNQIDYHYCHKYMIRQWNMFCEQFL